MATKGDLLQKQQRSLAIIVFVVGLLIFAISGYFWYTRVFSSPTNVFWGMVDNNFKSYGMTRSITQENASQGLKQSQSTRLMLGSQNISQGKTSIMQNNPQTGQVQIDTESIGTMSANYSKYTSINISKSASGKQPDFSQFENIWAVENNIPTGQLNLIQAMFGTMGTVPFGHLDAASRHKLVNYMKSNEVYKFTDLGVRRENKNGRPVYTYDVSVDLPKAVASLIMFDKLSGLNKLQGIDPEQYAGGGAVPLQMSIDILTHDIVEVSYGGGAQKEQFSSSGAYVKARVPEQTVPVSELQQKIQEIFQQ
jgi:hypothetical protein